MSNPDVGTSNISFSGLRASWGAAGYVGGTDPGSGSDSNISLSEFRGATFTTGPSVPDGSDEEISINDDFKERTFGQGTITYGTGGFRAYGTWSASSTYLTSWTYDKRVKLNSGQPSNKPYAIILLTPNATNSTTSPGIIVDREGDPDNCVDEVTVWFNVVAHAGSNQVQMGILAKDMTFNSWSIQLGYLHNKHATYCDRLSFHGAGYHNYAGSRDDLTSNTNIVSPAYTQNSGSNGKYGSNLTTDFHNRTGATAGTMRSYNAASAPSSSYNVYFFKNSYYNYQVYRGNSIYSNHGLKVKWYETTLQVSLDANSSTIQPVSPPSTWSSSDLTDVFSGMYVSGTGIPTGNGAFIGEIHTNYMILYRGKGTTTLDELDALTDQTNVTLTISGYLYWTLTTTSSYNNAKILGPPHTVLPKYQAPSNGQATGHVEIKEWAFFLGDTTSGTTNTFNYYLQDNDPGGTPFPPTTGYSVPYSSGTVPTGGGLFMNSSYLFSGTAGSALRGFNISLNTSSYYGSSVIGKTGHIVIRYDSGTYYTGDVQLVYLYINGIWVYPGRLSNGTGDFQRQSARAVAASALPPSVGYPSTWASISASGTGNPTAGYWYQRYGNTPSGNTGVTTSSTLGAIYYEASYSPYISRTAWLRYKEVTFTSNTVYLYFYSYAHPSYSYGMGKIYVGVEIT